MAFKYHEAVPWGRNHDEYQRMFNLDEKALKQKILGCGDGPASFNVECNERGGQVVSVDPIYNMTKQEIEKCISETYDNVISQTELNQEKFRWNRIASVEELGRVRTEAMNRFLDSYEEGKMQGRYIPGILPDIPFADGQFDIALSSHFLFLYTDNLSFEFHVDAIEEMLRVADEVRIFPLLDVNAKPSPYVERLLSQSPRWNIEITKVDYEFQIGGDQMMTIRSIT